MTICKTETHFELTIFNGIPNAHVYILTELAPPHRSDGVEYRLRVELPHEALVWGTRVLCFATHAQCHYWGEASKRNNYRVRTSSGGTFPTHATATNAAHELAANEIGKLSAAFMVRAEAHSKVG